MPILLLLLVSIMMLSACAVPTPAQPAAEQPADAEPTAAAVEEPMGESYEGVDATGQTVVWWHNHSSAREEGLKTLVQEFNETNEWGITIDAQNQGSYNDIRDKVNASIAAGEVPAALVVGYQNDQSFYQINDTLVDFDTLISDPTYGLSEEELADFYPSFLAVSVNPLFGNQRLGFPPNRSMEVLFYNQTWLEELGFSGPPTTPEEFKEMACAAAAAKGDGTGGYILRSDASAVAAWTMAFGGNVLTEDGTGYVYNGQATIDAMTLLKGMQDEGCAYLFTEGFPNPQFAARNAIFTQGSSSGIPFYKDNVETAATEQGRDPDVWGVTAIPHTTDEPVQNVYGGDVMIVKTTPEQELAAWLFVKWFTSPEIQARWSELSNYFPTRVSASEYQTEVYLAALPQYSQAVELLPYGAYEPQFVSYQAVRDQTEQTFNEIMQGADIQTALDTLTTFANDLQASMMAELQ
jgi:multiple sugar transport system substrate-binding protein/sn-glycerol 3-phosphate transport system substrate-binding protein